VSELVRDAAARSLAAVGPDTALKLLQGADTVLSSQQARVLELEAKVDVVAACLVVLAY
jgi:hypothetical protein